MLTVSARALIFYSGIIVTGVSFAFGYAKSGIGFLNTNFKWLMAIHSVFGCLGSVFFILGFKAYLWRALLSLHRFYLWHPQFWGSFLFNERVSILAWPAMLIGSIGAAIMFLDVMPEMRIGYGYLILGLLSASTSLVIARLIGKFESNPMALIFWPSLLMTLGAIVLIGATTAVALCEYRDSKER